jgi:hypothetical protein
MNLTNTNNLADSVRALGGTANASLSTARTGEYFDVRELGANVLTALVTAAAQVSGSTVTPTLVQATSSGGAGVKNLKVGTAVTVADDGASPPGSHSISAQVSANVSEIDLAGGFYFVAAKGISSTNVAGSVTLLASSQRGDVVGDGVAVGQDNVPVT